MEVNKKMGKLERHPAVYDFKYSCAMEYDLLFVSSAWRNLTDLRNLSPGSIDLSPATSIALVADTIKMSSEALHYLDAVELGRRIVSGSLSSVAATRAALERISALDGRLRSFALVDEKGALEQAELLDAELAAGKVRGPLHGVPIAVKDLLDVAGLRTGAGMPLRKVLGPAQKDAPVITRLRNAGCVILGKLQLTEGAFSEHHPSIPPPVNPYDDDRWTGVSSSGSGVATSAGLVFASLGTDTLGSIRFPSTMCGLSGLKPTWGLVPRADVFALSPSLDHIGPMCRSARDAAAVLGAIAGPDQGDPTAAPVEVPNYLEQLDKGIAGMRIGIDQTLVSRAHPEMAKAVFDAVEIFASKLGAEIVEVTAAPGSFDQAAATAFSLCATEVAVVHESTYPAQAAEYGPTLKGLIEAGLALSRSEVTKLFMHRDIFRGQMDALFASTGIDVLLLPAFDRPTITNTERAAVVADPAQRANRVLFTAPLDLSGNPSLTVPAGKTDKGHPFGMQIVGKRFGEAAILRAGVEWQRVTDWHLLRPIA